jgi:hypothetical protein
VLIANDVRARFRWVADTSIRLKSDDSVAIPKYTNAYCFTCNLGSASDRGGKPFQLGGEKPRANRIAALSEH